MKTNTKESISKLLKETGYLKNQHIEGHPDFPSINTICRLFNTTKMSDVWRELDIPRLTKSARIANILEGIEN